VYEYLLFLSFFFASNLFIFLLFEKYRDVNVINKIIMNYHNEMTRIPICYYHTSKVTPAMNFLLFIKIDKQNYQIHLVINHTTYSDDKNYCR